MTPKKVWGLIIIVLGILCFLNGARMFAEVEQIKLIEQQLSIFSGKNTHAASNITQKITKNVQSKGVANVLIGIAMAIFGTLMLSDNKKKQNLDYHKTDSTHSNGGPAVITEPERKELSTIEINPPEINETDNLTDSIQINKKPQIKPAKIINMQSGKDELESEETKWMPPEDKAKT